jgi:hypothetical protein
VKSRWAAAGFLTSCLLFAAYWICSRPAPNEPRYGFYSDRFIHFAQAYPIKGYSDQYQFLGSPAAALGVFHALNPPLLITTLGSDRFAASETPFWRSDWRFTVQAICVSFWWWWLLERVIEHRGRPGVTLGHVVLVIPALCLAASWSLYRWTWIRRTHGLDGFANAAPVISVTAMILGLLWARRQCALQLRPGVALIAAVSSIGLVLWPPFVLDSSYPGGQHTYSFAGHGWIMRALGPSWWSEPELVQPSRFQTGHELHVALNLLVTEVLLVLAGAVAAVQWKRRQNPQSQP